MAGGWTLSCFYQRRAAVASRIVNLTGESHPFGSHSDLGGRASDAQRRPTPLGVVLGLIVVGFAAFWIWALFFASKEAINRIEDRNWAARAEVICERATAERELLADYRRIDPEDPGLLRERADIIDRSTDIVESMLADVTAVPPTDAKGRDIVPQWEAEYRIYIENRRDFAAIVREGSYEPFREAKTNGIPISERLETFAVHNEMPACAPPRDL
jgi:hypothetical protein